MPERHGEDAAFGRCLEELARLDQEQRTLDLRDARAVAECQQRIEALREKIQRLRATGRPE